jgi:site-specific recombinase XerC
MRWHSIEQKKLNNLVFCNMFGRYLDCSNVRKRFKRILVANGMQDKKFHDLSYTYATRLFELKYNSMGVKLCFSVK